jgi:hypothetical protein
MLPGKKEWQNRKLIVRRKKNQKSEREVRSQIVKKPIESNQTSNLKPQTTNLIPAPINKEAKKELQKQQRIFQQPRNR